MVIRSSFSSSASTSAAWTIPRRNIKSLALFETFINTENIIITLHWSLSGVGCCGLTTDASCGESGEHLQSYTTYINWRKLLFINLAITRSFLAIQSTQKLFTRDMQIHQRRTWNGTEGDEEDACTVTGRTGQIPIHSHTPFIIYHPRGRST